MGIWQTKFLRRKNIAEHRNVGTRYFLQLFSVLTDFVKFAMSTKKRAVQPSGQTALPCIFLQFNSIKSSISYVAFNRAAMVCLGTRIVVSSWLAILLMYESSKPMSDASSGTRMPCYCLTFRHSSMTLWYQISRSGTSPVCTVLCTEKVGRPAIIASTM